MTVKDWAASVVRTAVAIVVGTALAWLARHLHIALGGPATDGAVQAFTAVVIGVYYGLVRTLEARWPAFGWFLGLATPPSYPTLADR